MGQEMFDLAGRRALVTGSSRGIGRAIALALAAHGADIAIHYASREAQAREVAEEAARLGARAVTVGGEIGQEGATARIAAEAAEKLGGGLDIAVANASVEFRRPWRETGWAEGHRQFDANFLSVLELAQAVLPGMQERAWGRFVTIGSVQQVRPNPQLVTYAALKSALVNLVRNLAQQVARSGVTVNNIAPGAIGTERNAGVLADPDYLKLAQSRIPMGFIGEPADCAGAVLLLCSPAGRYITGTDLLIDGGMHLG